MGVAIAWSTAIFLVVALVHLRLLDAALAWAGGGSGGRPAAGRLSGFLLATLAIHLIGAIIFAAGFWGGQRIGLGGFSEGQPMGAMDYFYFSLVNITTLGLGDNYPTDHLRFLTGVESLGGFLLISTSASYIFKVVRPDE